MEIIKWKVALKEVWLHFGNFLPLFIASPKISNVNNIVDRKHLDIKFNMR